jgi:hypothetical protein
VYEERRAGEAEYGLVLRFFPDRLNKLHDYGDRVRNLDWDGYSGDDHEQ